MFSNKNEKMHLRKTVSKIIKKTIKWPKRLRKRGLFKGLWAQRHGNSYGFVKTGCATEVKCLHPFFDTLAELVDLGCDFGAHWILNGVPKSIIFLLNNDKIN